MGLISTIGKVATSKIIEKVEDNIAKKHNREQTIKYAKHIKNSIVRIRYDVDSLQKETKLLIDLIISKKDIKMTFKEKEKYRNLEEKASTNLKYLYLSRDFFMVLAKNINGVELNDEELMLVIKFAPYFDGTPVLSIENERDYSFLGELKDLGREFKSTFVSSKVGAKQFNLSEYLNRHNSKISELYIPDINSAIESFEKVMSLHENSRSLDDDATAGIETPVISDNTIECQNCHAQIIENYKFCPECGSKIEMKKQFFYMKKNKI